MDQRKSPLVWIVGLAAVVLLGLGLWKLRDGKSSSDPTAADSRGGDDPDRGEPQRPRPELGLDLEGADKAAISGTVRAAEGEPIVGARVCALSEQDDLRGLGDHRPRCVTSGADGHYRIEGLWPVRTNVEASAPHFIPNRWQARDAHGHVREQVALAPGQTAAGIDVVLSPGGVLVQGIVRDITGGEIEGALVVGNGRRSIQHGLGVTETDESGAFELWAAPGSLAITAMAEGYADGQGFAVAPGAKVELFLTPESVLVGRVVHAQTQAPVADVTVSVTASRGRGRFGGRERATRTDDAGNFRIDRLEPGIYKPTAVADELYGEAAEQVHLGLGETSEPVEVVVHPAYYVSGTVTIAGGERPCPEGRVSLRADQRTQAQESIGTEGFVEIRGVFPGEYTVEVQCEGYLSEDDYPGLTIVDQSLTGQVWEVREGLAIRGEVVDADGTPLAAVSVGARMVVDGEGARGRRTNERVETEDDGSFVLAALLPGNYEVSAGTDWGRGRPGPEAPARVELAPGADVNDVRIVMPATGELHGRLVDEHGQPVADMSIQATPVGLDTRQSVRTNDAGEFWFETLRPGQTRVRAGGGFGGGLRAPGTSDDDVQGEVVEIVAAQTAEVELVVEARGGVIRGRVVDEAGGPVGDAFVEAERMSEEAGASGSRARFAVRWSFGRKPVLTDQDGRFELDDLTEGRFVVRAHRKGGGEAVVEGVEAGADVELVIAATGELGGKVVLAGGGAPEQFEIVVRDREAGLAFGDEFFRTNGAWSLRELPPGSYQVSASSTAGSTELDVELGEGESRTNLVLELQNLVTIRGRIVDIETREPVPGFEVNAAGSSGMRGRARPSDVGGELPNVTDADGRFELGGVPSGDVRIIARIRTGGTDSPYDFAFVMREIQPEPAVQDIGEIEAIARRLDRGKQAGDLGFEIKRPDNPGAADFRAVVVLVRPGGPAAAAGLELGAVIESVDGHAIDGDINRYYKLANVPEGRTVALGLEDGGRVEITATAPR